jgi:hypothetical protein
VTPSHGFFRRPGGRATCGHPFRPAVGLVVAASRRCTLAAVAWGLSAGATHAVWLWKRVGSAREDVPAACATAASGALQAPPSTRHILEGGPTVGNSGRAGRESRSVAVRRRVRPPPFMLLPHRPASTALHQRYLVLFMATTVHGETRRRRRHAARRMLGWQWGRPQQLLPGPRGKAGTEPSQKRPCAR